MLSTRLVQLIEAHWDEIAQRLIVAVRNNPNLQELSRRPDIELREWCQEIVENLGSLLTAPKRDEVRTRYNGLGKMRFEENIPLHEAVLRFRLLKETIFNFIHEHDHARGFLATQHGTQKPFDGFASADVLKAFGAVPDAKSRRLCNSLPFAFP